MNSNYQTAKFLANERVHDQLANAMDYRQVKNTTKGQVNESTVNNMKHHLNESRQRVTETTSYLVSLLRGVGGARTATQ